jgi:drug/metabolite transporter (DMT)-like permease
MGAIAYSLLAAVSWGLADFTAGFKSRSLGVLTVLLWVESVGLTAVMIVIAASGTAPPSAHSLLYAAIAGAAGFSALGAFYQALSIGTMSIVAPISATGVVVPVVVGLATGDSLTALVAAGLVVTIAGVLLASREEAAELVEGGAAAPDRRAILLALAAAVGFGLYFTFADVASDGSVLWMLATGRIVILPPVIALALYKRVSIIPPVRERWQLCAVGLADLGATGLYGVATTRGALSVVSVIGSLYPVVTVLLARGLLKERITRVQAVGVGVAFAGVALVSAG